MLRVSTLAATLFLSAAAGAQETEGGEGFVEANILSIFYHELGHAVIDQMQVPIFGQEEDAADVMAVLLIDWLFEEEAAQSIAYDSAFGYINDPEGTQEVLYWDLHGPDDQRYYNHICLFYGANPDDREELAQELGLPEERAETCPEEYDQAAESWGVVFEAMDESATGVPMVFVPGSGKHAEIVNRMLEAEVASLNADLTLPGEVVVKVESCEEANAFYDPQEVSITFCTEFIPHLGELWGKLTAE